MLCYLKSPALLFCLLLVGCHSPQEFQQRNDHDTVLKFASSRTDNKRSGTQWAKVLESSFAQANDMDLRKIGELKALNTAEAWERIHVINQRIEKRHDRVEPLLPIVSEDGYRPNIRLLPVKAMLAESRQAVIDHSVPEIEENLRIAENGQQLNARKAYDRINILQKEYHWADYQAKELQSKALALGKTYVLLEMGYRWDFFNSQSVIRYLEFRGASNSKWQVVHFKKQSGFQYDFRVQAEIMSADVSFDDLSTSCRTVTEEVQVGQEAVKDSTGKVVSYNPIYQTVSATIQDVRASKDANLSVQVEVFDFKTGDRLRSDLYVENEYFSESFCTYTGDARVSETSSCRFSNAVFFPTDSQMMDECASDFRYRLSCMLQQLDLEN